MKNKVVAILVTVMAFMLVMTGCTPAQEKVTDREGNEVVLPEKMERIISTAPSNTEVLVELGLSDKLVAVDTYSTDIDGLDKNLPTIDFSNPDAETILDLKPDIIIASGHNKTGSSEDPFKLMKDAGISVVYIPSSDSIEGVYEDIMFIADITNNSEKGKVIVDGMKEEVEAIRKVGSTITDKKNVYFEIAPAPGIFTFGTGTFLNEMIEIVGAENIFADEKGWISPSDESVINANPDVILTNVNYIDNPIDEIKSRSGWENINAVKDGNVKSISTNASARPSQNIIVALKEIAKAVYPSQYE